MALSLPSADEVRVVVSTALTDEQIESVIRDAALVVEQCSAIAGYECGKQAAIIKFWTADMIVGIGNQGGGAVTSDRLGDASRSFSTANLDKGAVSYYRQRAYDLDGSGCLRRIGKPKATLEKV